MVAEVSSNLTHHGGYSERQEIRAVVNVVSIDRADQADAGNLHEIIMRFAPSAVAAGDMFSQGQAPFRYHLTLATKRR